MHDASDRLAFMRTTVDLPEPLLDNARLRAAELNVTLSDVVQDGLRMVLNAQSVVRPKKFKLLTVGGGLVDPNLDLDKISGFIAKEDEEEYLGKFGK
jgi:hypothetical protein